MIDGRVNAALNPLGTLLRCRNGDVIATDDGKHVIRACCAEVATVMIASGLREVAGVVYEDVETLSSPARRKTGFAKPACTVGSRTFR